LKLKNHTGHTGNNEFIIDLLSVKKEPGHYEK